MTDDASTVTFAALGLVKPVSECMWRLPAAVSGAVLDLCGDDFATTGDWREVVILPLYRDVIVPALPVRVEATYRDRGDTLSPVLTTCVDGVDVTMPWRTPQHILNLLADDQYTLTLPVTFLAAVLLGVASIRHLKDVPLASIEVALAAGLSSTETRDRYTDGTLDPATLSALAALRS